MMTQPTQAQGADYSVWQDQNSTPQPVDFYRARKAGLSFAYIKVSQANWADPDYAINWVNARRWLHRGPYHFLTWDVTPRRQADVFWSLLAKDSGELPLICDFEWYSTIPRNALDILRGFLERMKELTSRTLGIYTANAFWKQYGSLDSYWKQYILWLSDISGPVEVPKPWDTWDFHQYTFKGDGPKYGAESEGLDLDRYNGTLAQMERRFGLRPLPDLEPEPTPDPTVGLKMRVVATLLNIRTGPGTNYADVGDLHNGDLVTVEDVGGGDSWVKIGRDRWACVRLGATVYMRKA